MTRHSQSGGANKPSTKRSQSTGTITNIAGMDLAGKTVRLRPEFFRPGLDHREHLFFCEGGFGCNPGGMGTKIFGHFLSDGEECYIRRQYIEAVVELP